AAGTRGPVLRLDLQAQLLTQVPLGGRRGVGGGAHVRAAAVVLAGAGGVADLPQPGEEAGQVDVHARLLAVGADVHLPVPRRLGSGAALSTLLAQRMCSWRCGHGGSSPTATVWWAGPSRTPATGRATVAGAAPRPAGGRLAGNRGPVTPRSTRGRLTPRGSRRAGAARALPPPGPVRCRWWPTVRRSTSAAGAGRAAAPEPPAPTP